MNIYTLLVGGLILLLVVRAVLKKIGSLTATPRRVQLVPATAAGKHANELRTRKRELDECELKRIGTYRVDPLNVIATAFANDQEAICAVIYHHPAIGSFVDMCSKSTGGRSFTVSSAPMGGALDQREGHDKVFDKTLSIPAMFQLVLKRRPAGPWENWTAQNFAGKFEAAYAEEMDWRAARGGVTVDEVRRQAKEDGNQYTEEVIQKAAHAIQEQWAETERNPR